MPAAGMVTIALAVVVILVLAGFLLQVARVLVDVHRKLGTVIDAVATIASQAKPVEPVVRSIDENLATGREVLGSLLESKLGADGAAQLVASVDPLAEAPAENHGPLPQDRVSQLGDEPADHPAPEEEGPASYESFGGRRSW